MKTRITITAILISLFFNLSMMADGFQMKEEVYIDDIPFDTQAIAKNHLQEKASTIEFELAKEDYIDDIPFNTSEVYSDYMAEKAMAVVFEMPEECYINDIPFNTLKIAFKARLYELIFSSNI